MFGSQRAKGIKCFQSILRMKYILPFRGTPVNVTCDLDEVEADLAMKSPLFTNWLASLDPKLFLKSVHIQSVDKFSNGKIGFLKAKATVFDADNLEGHALPGIIFMRGPSVAVLIVIQCGDKKFTLLTEQARVPIGKRSFLEIPAGMLDDDSFKGAAARELEEETGLVIHEKDLVDLTGSVYGEDSQGMYPSPGGCDEYIRLFSYEISMEQEKLIDLQGKLSGLRDHGEYIRIRIIPFEDLLQSTPDAKSICALSLYTHLQNQKNSK